MNIYQPAVFWADQNDLAEFACELAAKLFPGAVLLSPTSGGDPVRLRFRVDDVFHELDLYARDVGDEEFEAILKAVAELEVARKEQQDTSLKQIGICVIAHSFSNDFLNRLSFSLPNLNVFTWRLIHSEADDALLVERIGDETQKQFAVDHSLNGHQMKLNTPVQARHPQLSESEQVAFTRLGMELRQRTKTHLNSRP